LGIYPGKTSSLDDLKDGAVVTIPNETSNEARSLLLLQQEGLITLSDDAGLGATKEDIVDNPLNLDIQEIDGAQLVRSLDDADIAVITGNYALDAGLSVSKDALATESSESEAAYNYGNILAVNKGDENNPAVLKLLELLQSDKVKEFMESEYDGAVVPLF
jgi:D-methionine transport system substrate-binding protein